MVAMRERNTCISGATCRCGDAGHHFEPDPCRRKRLQLLAAAAENEGIAALQPAYALALLGEPDQQRIDLLLRDVRCARRLAYIDALRIAPREIEHLPRHEAVVQHDIRILQRAQSPQGEQTRITRPCTDEHDLTGVLRQIRLVRERTLKTSARFFALGIDSSGQHVRRDLAVEKALPEASPSARALQTCLDGCTQRSRQPSERTEARGQKRLELLSQPARQYRRIATAR